MLKENVIDWIMNRDDSTYMEKGWKHLDSGMLRKCKIKDLLKESVNSIN